MAMPNPADGLKEVAKELKEKFDEAGMGAVDEFVDTLDEIKEKAASGPGDMMDAVKAKMNEFMKTIEEIIKDPSSLVPSAGPAAMLANWYANSVATKLQALKKMVEDFIQMLVDVAGKVLDPMKNVGTVISEAMKTLEGTLKKLAKLPAEVGKMAAEIDSPDDIAKIDVAPMKSCLNVAGFETPLGNVKGLQGGISDAVLLVQNLVDSLMEFLDNAATHIKDAFSVPFPCCCCTSAAHANAPKGFTDMMANVDKLKAVDLTPLKTLMSKTGKAVGDIDVEVIKIPVSKFAASAGESLDKLEKTVAGAKLASNPAGAVGGALGSMGMKSPF
jgi:hypothetical protein